MRGNIMKYNILLVLFLVFGSAHSDEELERSTITSCAYQAGTAREVQSIRQVEGDDWLQFKLEIKKIYKDTQGRRDLLAIAKMVYLQPSKAFPDDVYNQIFKSCVKHIQGKDTSA